jgi:hypothetical protein
VLHNLRFITHSLSLSLSPQNALYFVTLYFLCLIKLSCPYSSPKDYVVDQKTPGLQLQITANKMQRFLNLFICFYIRGTLLVEQLVEALRHKLESRGFDSRWCHWNLSLT